MDWFKIGKGVREGWISSPCLFSLQAVFSSVHFSHSIVSDSANPWNAACFPIHHQILEWWIGKFESAQTHLYWVNDAIKSSYLLLSPSPPAFNLSQHQDLFQWVSSSHQVATYWSFSFSISPYNVYPGLISFRIDWFHLLAVQGTLRSLFQHHSSKASILQCSAFFMVQHSHLYMTTGKTIALTRWTFVGKIMSLLFNMLTRFVIAFLSRSLYLLIWRLQSPSAGILEPKKIKAVTFLIVFPSICHEEMGPDAMSLFFEFF